jgi:hypothetical protein
MRTDNYGNSIAFGVAFGLLMILPVQAADMSLPATAPERNMSLLKGGIASIYVGHIDYESGEVDISDTQTQIIGGRGAISIPFMDNFSIQIDALGEHTLDRTGDGDQTIADLTFAGHVSYRDPSMYLVGLFGGGGRSFDNGDDDDGEIPFYFIGAEAQAYWNDFTAYAQAGYLDGEDFYLENVEDAWFGRGVISYYYMQNTKIAGEISFVSGDRRNNTPGGPGDLEVFGWGAKIQHMFDTPVLSSPAGISLAYNGYNYKATDESDSPDVHEFRIGFDFVFGSPSLIDNDRRAAGLDLPPINRWVSTSTNEIE